MDAAQVLVDLFKFTKMTDPTEDFDASAQLKEAEKYKDVLVCKEADECAGKMADALNKAGKSVFISFVQDFAKKQKGHVSADTLLAAIWLTLGWKII